MEQDSGSKSTDNNLCSAHFQSLFWTLTQLVQGVQWIPIFVLMIVIWDMRWRVGYHCQSTPSLSANETRDVKLATTTRRDCWYLVSIIQCDDKLLYLQLFPGYCRVCISGLKDRETHKIWWHMLGNDKTSSVPRNSRISVKITNREAELYSFPTQSSHQQGK